MLRIWIPAVLTKNIFQQLHCTHEKMCIYIVNDLMLLKFLQVMKDMTTPVNFFEIKILLLRPLYKQTNSLCINI